MSTDNFTQTFARLTRQGTLEERHRVTFRRIYEANAHAPENVELYARLARRQVEIEERGPDPEHEAYVRAVEAYARTLGDTRRCSFDTIFARLVRDGRLKERHRDAYRRSYDVNGHDRSPSMLVSLANIIRLVDGGTGAPGAAAAPAGDRLLTLAANLPASELSGDEGLDRLNGDVTAFAAERDVDWWTAASSIVNPHLIEQALEDAPLKIEDGVDPESAELDRRARQLAGALSIGYVDAAMLAQLDDELAEAEAEDGRAAAAWLDTSRPVPPRPYGEGSLEDWERDKRRAKNAGVQVPQEYWQQAAEEGRDLVYETAVEARRARVDGLRAQRDQLLEQARSVERAKRQRALTAGLDQRARDRLRPR